MKSHKTNIVIQTVLLIITIAITASYLFWYGVVSVYIADGVTDNATWGMYAGWVATAGFPVVGLLILAAWFTKGGKKAVPIICAIICSIVIGMAYFAYTFRYYGS